MPRRNPSTMSIAEFGKVEKVTFEETQIEWTIDIFLVAKDHDVFGSPVFFVAGSSWKLIVWGNEALFPENLVMRLSRERLRDSSVDCCISLKKSHESVKQLHCSNLDESCGGTILFNLIKQSEIPKWKSQLMTITCILKCQLSHATPQFSYLKRLDKLSENFKGLLGNEETCDTTLKVKEKVYKAHRAVLIAQSPVLAAMFMHNTSERQTGVITIPDCDPDSFPEFLEYLYCGKLEKISFPTVFHLYETSNKYDVPEVKEFCVGYLRQCMTVENICKIVVFTDKYDETELFTASQDFFNNNVSKIFETSEWESLIKMDYRLANKLLKVMSKVRLTE